MHVRWILVSLSLLLLTHAAHAQPVSGTVHGEGGVPLEGATVRLMTGTASQGTTTDRYGVFRLDSDPGTFQLEVRHLGYLTLRQVVEIPAEGVTLDLALVQAPLYGGDLVAEALRARPQLTPVTHTNISARELAQLPTMRDMPAHLARSVSITHYSENGNDLGYTYLKLRGFGQRRVAVAINGIPQNDPEEHNVFWINFFDLQGSIRDIQVQRGAGAAFYGSTGIGGAINIVTDPFTPEPNVRLEAGYGTWATQRYTITANSGLLGERYAVYVRASRLLSDGYRDWSFSEFWRYFAGIRRYGKRHTFTLQSYGGPQYDGLAYVGIPKDANVNTVTDEFGTRIDRRYNFSAATGDIERFHQPHAELIHEYEANDRLRLRQTLFWVQGVGEFDFGGTFRSADYLRLPADWRGLTEVERSLPLYVSAPDASVLFRAALDQWQVGYMPRLTRMHARGETTVAAEFRLHRSLRWGRVEEASGLPSSVVGPAADYRVYSFRNEKQVASLHGSHLARPLDRLAVQADLQLTWRRYRLLDEAFFGHSFAVPYLFANPRIGITFNPERPNSAYLSVALASREPRMKSLYDGEEAGAGFLPQFEATPNGAFDYGRPRVRPERVTDVELGWSHVRPLYSARANVYWMRFRNEIVPSGGLDQFGVPRTGNADRTRHTGLEMDLSARLTPRLDAYANVTVSRSRLVRFTEYAWQADGSVASLDRSGNPIAGFPDRTGSVGVTYASGGFSLRLEAKRAGIQYVDNSGGVDAAGRRRPDLFVDGYTLVSGGARWAVTGDSALNGFELALDVSNLLDSRVLLYGNAGFGAPQFYPSATRHWFLTARYHIR